MFGFWGSWWGHSIVVLGNAPALSTLSCNSNNSKIQGGRVSVWFIPIREVRSSTWGAISPGHMQPEQWCREWGVAVWSFWRSFAHLSLSLSVSLSQLTSHSWAFSFLQSQLHLAWLLAVLARIVCRTHVVFQVTRCLGKMMIMTPGDRPTKGSIMCWIRWSSIGMLCKRWMIGFIRAMFCFSHWMNDLANAVARFIPSSSWKNVQKILQENPCQNPQ